MWGMQGARYEWGLAWANPQGYSSFVDKRDEAITKSTWSVSLTATATPFGIGGTVEVGLLYNKGDIKVYYSAGLVYGADLSAGLNFTYYDTKKDISFKDIKGWGEGYNLGLGFFDFGEGGNSMYPGLKSRNFRDYHPTYDTYSFGISCGSPFGFTREKSITVFKFKEFFKKNGKD